MEFFHRWIEFIQGFLNLSIVAFGKTQLILWTFLELGIRLFLLVYFTANIMWFYGRKMAPGHQRLDSTDA